MAGLPWIPLDVTFPTGVKAVALGVALQKPLAWAHVVRLWAWAAQHAADGRVEGPASVQIIEAAAAWDGPAGALVEACSLPHVRLLDVTERGFYIHDWHEHCGAHVKKREEDRDRKRAERAAKRPRTVRGQSTDVPGKSADQSKTESKTEKLASGPDSDAPREIPPRVRAFQHALSEALGKTRAMPIAAADRVWSVCDEIDLLLAAHDSPDSVVAACVTHALGSGTSPKTLAWFVQFLRELGPPQGPAAEHVAPTPIHLLPAVEFDN